MSWVWKAMLNLVVRGRAAVVAFRWAAAAVLAAVVVASLGVGISGAASRHESAARPADAQARAVVRSFFQTIDARQFPARATCSAGASTCVTTFPTRSTARLASLRA